MLVQRVQIFIRYHAEAFRYFGGVPQTVKTDNLKVAIVEADLYGPTLQRTYTVFAEHYGFLSNSCYIPTDKGKVESKAKYVKDNCIKAALDRGFHIFKIHFGNCQNRLPHYSRRKLLFCTACIYRNGCRCY